MAGTPHIAAKAGEIAEICIVPGDPKRAQYLAEKYFKNAVQVTSVRNMFGYTGYVDSTRVSVMAVGMGGPSCTIYLTELLREYGVKVLLRVGTCGTVMAPAVRCGDLVLAVAAGCDSSMNRLKFNNYDMAACADFDLLQRAAQECEKAAPSLRYHAGRVFSTDFFYHPQDEQLLPLLKKHQYVGLEMEASHLYSTAAEHGARALAIMTVTDEIHVPSSFATGKCKYVRIPPEERQTGLDKMLAVAMQVVRGLGKEQATKRPRGTKVVEKTKKAASKPRSAGASSPRPRAAKKTAKAPATRKSAAASPPRPGAKEAAKPRSSRSRRSRAAPAPSKAKK